MNLQFLNEAAQRFQELVINSGFHRNIKDYLSSYPNIEGNIMQLREVCSEVSSALDTFHQTDLPDMLKVLLPEKQNEPFTEGNTKTGDGYLEELIELRDNATLELSEFAGQLLGILQRLDQHIDRNVSQIDRITNFIKPYLAGEEEWMAGEGAAVVSIIFRDRKTITNLKEFSKTVARWNRVLPIYQQLISSDSPSDYEILEIQNGSIDVILNVDLKVALDLAEVFKIGFKAFAAYLAYKRVIKPVLEGFKGSKDMEKLETDREKLMLSEIRHAIGRVIEEQHDDARKEDPSVDSTAVPKKLDQVTQLFTFHIVRGNDIKLLALPQSADEKEGSEGGNDGDSPLVALRTESMAAQLELGQATEDAKKELLELYEDAGDSE